MNYASDLVFWLVASRIDGFLELLVALAGLVPLLQHKSLSVLAEFFCSVLLLLLDLALYLPRRLLSSLSLQFEFSVGEEELVVNQRLKSWQSLGFLNA
jgi:hypothetical protein